MAAKDKKENKESPGKKSSRKKNKEVKQPLFSVNQKRVFLIVIVLMFLMVPIAENLRCKAACLKRVKTPYPEIACKYQCPWFWEKP